ncbi:MAG: hypothetical protein EP344_06165, partial [Bacteroidetes bacterium]
MKIKDFLEGIELDNLQVRVKTIQEPVAKPQSGTASDASSLFTSVGTAALPSNFDVFDQGSSGTTAAQAGDPAPEDVLDGVLEKISNAFTPGEGGTDLIAVIMEKLETAIIESGFYSELDTRREAFISAVTGSDLTVEKILDAVIELLSGLIESAINALIDVLEYLLDDLKEIVRIIQDNLLDPGTGTLVEALFEQFGIQDLLPDYELGMLSMPAFLIGLPVALLSVAVTGEKPVFPNFSPNDDDEAQKNKAMGAIQLCKVLLPFIGQGSYELSRYKAKKGLSIGIGTLGDLSALAFDSYEQFSDIPGADEKTEKQALWYFELAVLAANLFIMLAKLYEDYKDLSENKTQSTAQHRVEIFWPSIQTAMELLNIGFSSIVYYSTDETEREDPEAYFWLDALPGLIENVFSFGYTYIDTKVEQMVDNNEDLLDKLSIKLTSLLEDDPALWTSGWDINDPMYLFYTKIEV